MLPVTRNEAVQFWKCCREYLASKTDLRFVSELAAIEKAIERAVKSARAGFGDGIDLSPEVAPELRWGQQRNNLVLLNGFQGLRDKGEEALPPDANIFIVIVRAIHRKIVGPGA